MNRLVRIVRNSRGWSEFSVYLAQRRQQPTTPRGWWLWPFALVLFGLGTVMLVAVVLYSGTAFQVIFTLVWLTLVAYMAWPSRRVWMLHRAQRRNR